MDITKNWKIQVKHKTEKQVEEELNMKGIAFFVDGDNIMDLKQIKYILEKQLKNKKRYLVGSEGGYAEGQPRPHHHIWISEDEDRAYTNIIKNIRDHYKQNGKILGGKNNKKATHYYGRTKKIKDEIKMKAYTIKEGNYIANGFSKQALEALEKIGYSKETEDKHCKNCNCHRFKKMEKIIIHMKEYKDIGHKDIIAESIRQYVQVYNQIPNKQQLLKIYYKIGYMDEMAIAHQLNLKMDF